MLHSFKDLRLYMQILYFYAASFNFSSFLTSTFISRFLMLHLFSPSGYRTIWQRRMNGLRSLKLVRYRSNPAFSHLAVLEELNPHDPRPARPRWPGGKRVSLLMDLIVVSVAYMHNLYGTTPSQRLMYVIPIAYVSPGLLLPRGAL